MKARNIRFIRELLAGNEIKFCKPTQFSSPHMGRKIEVKAGTLLDKMGIKDIYSDKAGGVGWNSNKFIGDRFIALRGKHTDMCSDAQFRIPQSDQEIPLFDLKEFLQILYRFRQ